MVSLARFTLRRQNKRWVCHLYCHPSRHQRHSYQNERKFCHHHIALSFPPLTSSSSTASRYYPSLSPSTSSPLFRLSHHHSSLFCCFILDQSQSLMTADASRSAFASCEEPSATTPFASGLLLQYLLAAKNCD